MVSEWQRQNLFLRLVSLPDWPSSLPSPCPVARNTSSDNWFLLDMRPHPGLLAGDPGIRITSLQCFLPPSRQAVTVLGHLLSRCAALCSEAQSLSASLSSVDSASQKAPGASLLPQRKAGLPSLSALPVPQVLEVFPPSPMALPLLNLLRPAPTSPFCMLGTGWGVSKNVTSAQRSLST